MLLGPGVTIVYGDRRFTGDKLAQALARQGGYTSRPVSSHSRMCEYAVAEAWLLWLPMELELFDPEVPADFHLRLSRLEDLLTGAPEKADALQLISCRPQLPQTPYYRLVYVPDEWTRVDILGPATFDFGELGLWFQIVPNRFAPEASAKLPEFEQWRRVALGAYTRAVDQHPFATRTRARPF